MDTDYVVQVAAVVSALSAVSESINIITLYIECCYAYGGGNHYNIINIAPL